MKVANMHEAKTHLARLVEAAVNGEEVIIAKGGQPKVKLVPVDRPQVRFGFLSGISIAPDFDETPEDFKDYI